MKWRILKVCKNTHHGSSLLDYGKESTCQPRGTWVWSLILEYPTEQRSPCTTAAEPTALQPVPWDERSHCKESLLTATSETPPCVVLTRESPGAATKTQHSRKTKMTMESTQHMRFNTHSYHISLSRSVVQKGWESIMDVVNERRKGKVALFCCGEFRTNTQA